MSAVSPRAGRADDPPADAAGARGGPAAAVRPHKRSASSSSPSPRPRPPPPTLRASLLPDEAASADDPASDGCHREGIGWLISPDFSARRVRYRTEPGGFARVCDGGEADGCCIGDKLVRMVASPRELAGFDVSGRGDVDADHVLLAGPGVGDVSRHYATRGRPLAGYAYWCDLLYSTREQQVDMVADRPRTDFLRRAIERHCPGRRVLEIGVGSGVLLAFAARAGATKVQGFEAVAEAAELARETLRRNGLSEEVTVIEGLAEELIAARPADEVWDVIVSESIGIMGFCEWMVMSVLVSRVALAPGGQFLPASISLRACPVWASFAHEPHGVDMAHLVPAVLAPVRVPTNALLPLDAVGSAEGVELARLDFTSARPADLSWRCEAAFVPSAGGRLTGLCVWFDLACAEGCCTLSTSPSAEPTHWQQALLSFHPKVLVARAGVPLRLRFDVFPAASAPAEAGADSSGGSSPPKPPLLAVGVVMRCADGAATADGEPFEAEWAVPTEGVVLRDLPG
eukprot:TRINITY_DN54101_c0_g1_i1.p1 TRINITY_DN54101_c0_g1~~TRINITY_DN54101_c0_g1_i1.p1  ORF type:complete len:515 (-),score=113.91 TRINITY_DN54101_c0_g1_i1:152-1696(-)